MDSTHIHDIDPDTEPQPVGPHLIRRRLALILAVLLVLLLLIFIPPLISVSRFQRRIATNIGASLGRPVHFDRVSLTLLPMPGFTLDNFVVEEDPAFGSEPILRAGQVRATLRIGSLWRKRVEISRISLSAGDNGTAPSVNLVHRADGRWNIDRLLLQASHIEAAPTAQTYAGPAPRFPYVEATGARVNLKLDQEKTPFSLTDADFALWLPQPHQWHLRVEAHPVRTDISPGETGTLRLEGALGGVQPAPLRSPPSFRSPSTSTATGAMPNSVASAVSSSVATLACAGSSPSPSPSSAPSTKTPSQARSSSTKPAAPASSPLARSPSI